MRTKIPMGYKLVDGVMTIDNYESAIVIQIYNWYLKGSSLFKIKQMLEDNEIKTINGLANWQHSTISKILSNSKYCGSDYYPQLVDDILFNDVQVKLEYNTKKKEKSRSYSRRSDGNTLVGKIYCSKCGNLYSKYAQKRSGYIVKWKCRSREVKNINCNNIKITNDRLMEFMKELIFELKNTPQLISSNIQTDNAIRSVELVRINNCIEKLEIEEEYNQEYIDLNYRRSELLFTLSGTSNTKADTDKILKTLKETDSVDVSSVVENIIESITVCEDNKLKIVLINGAVITKEI